MKRRRKGAYANVLVGYSVAIILHVINTQSPSFIMHCSWSVVETVFGYRALKSMHMPKISLHMLNTALGVSEPFEMKMFTCT